MPIQTLQRCLEEIYEVEIPHDVLDFIVTDRTWRLKVEPLADPDSEIKEKLFVVQDGENLDLALYLDEEVIDRLSEENPSQLLHSGNLSDYWIALEGVSHFLYLIWNANREQSVTLLELEIQAEIDKFIATFLTLGQQRDGMVPADLHQWLFEDHTFDESLDELSLERYRSANRYAAKYCNALQHRYLRKALLGPLMEELRHFYRLPQAEKIRHIDSISTEL